jgi:hypothetical protein
MQKEQLPITCPLCGRKDEYPLDTLFEGATFTCTFCKLQLKLHGHMWEDIRKEIAIMRKNE